MLELKFANFCKFLFVYRWLCYRLIRASEGNLGTSLLLCDEGEEFSVYRLICVMRQSEMHVMVPLAHAVALLYDRYT